MINLILASASPARRKLLEMAGLQPMIKVSDFDENSIVESNPQFLAEKLSYHKAETVAKQVTNSVIIGCDSLLVVRGETHGKPKDEEEAIERWKLMSGEVGILYTGHTIFDQINHLSLTRCGMTKVYFAQLKEEEIKAYVKTGEPLNCAGCFALEGKGGLLVEKIEGCHTNVIGLSLPLLRSMLSQLGYSVQDFW